jgi:cardiolipin synthase (CMP-forming)
VCTTNKGARGVVGNSSAPDAAAEGEQAGPDLAAGTTAGVRADVPAREPDPDRLPDRIWTVPNALSIARLLGVPVFLWLVLGPHADGWAVILLIAAAASDWLDGKLARALHQESRLGQVLDPTADRLYIGVMLIGLAIRGIIPWWLVGVLVGRELVLAVALLRLRSRGWEPLQVSFVGKAATLCLFYAFPLLLLGAYSGDAALVAKVVGWAFVVWGTALYWAAAGVYLLQAWRLTSAPAGPAPGGGPAPGDGPAAAGGPGPPGEVAEPGQPDG